MRKLLSFFIGTMLTVITSCREETDLSPYLVGFWQQAGISVDGIEQVLSAGELNTSLLIEANGIYRLYDGVREQERPGTWLFSDGDWMNMTMDRISVSYPEPDKDSTIVFSQGLVRFTILQVNESTMQLQIKTYLFDRKKTVMFTLLDQDVNPQRLTYVEQMALDKENKQLHTYLYTFEKINDLKK